MEFKRLNFEIFEKNLGSLDQTFYFLFFQSQAMAVVAAGALVSNIPIITLINWYGPRYLFTVVGLFGAVATALIPHAMQLGWGW